MTKQWNAEVFCALCGKPTLTTPYNGAHRHMNCCDDCYRNYPNGVAGVLAWMHRPLVRSVEAVAALDSIIWRLDHNG